MRIQADRQVCIGSGNCVFVAGAVFDQDADAKVVLLTETPAAGQEGRAAPPARVPPGSGW